MKVKRLRKGADGEDELVLPNITSLDNNRFTLPVEVSCMSTQNLNLREVPSHANN